jgi:hypothetical protein
VFGSFDVEPHGPGGESPETEPALIAQMPQFWPPHAPSFVEMDGVMPLSLYACDLSSWPIQASVIPAACIPARKQPS